MLCARDRDVTARAVAIDDPCRTVQILIIRQRGHRVGRGNDGRTGGTARKAADRQKILPRAIGGRASGDRRWRIGAAPVVADDRRSRRSEEHTSELQSLMRISYAVLCLKKKKNTT